MKNKKVTMQDIANELGITKVSVSKALNNQPGISDDLKKKILQVSSNLGYSNEKISLSYEIDKFAFIVPKRFFLENENFYTTIYYYLNKACLNKSISLSLFVINAEEEKNLSIPSMLNKDNCNGIFFGGELSDPYLHAISNINLPMISIDFYKPHMDMDCIITDNFYISYSITSYLIENGHTKIGFVGNSKQTSSIMDRFFGFQKALSVNNIRYVEEWSVSNNDPNTGYYSLDFNLPSTLPTAFVCHCDMAAYFLVQKLQSSGIKIPEDVSIVSFDNTEISRVSNPPISTIDINKKDFADKSLEQMINRIKNPSLPPQRIYINTELILRESILNIAK